MKPDNQEIASTLISFLKTPLSSGDDIFERFKDLPHAVYKKGNHPLERFLYVPGTKGNRVLLIAHVDTIWDKNYIKEAFSSDLAEKDGVLYNSNKTCGIGADDRAGCAILWLLKSSGHSLLLLDGEEYGHFGAKFLRKDKKLMKEINNHCFLLQLDFWGKDEYRFHSIMNPQKFKRFIESNGYIDSGEKSGGTDVSYICKKASGVNVSVGYLYQHSKHEQISVNNFEFAYKKVVNLISNVHTNYRVSPIKRLYKFIRHIIALLIKPIARRIKSLFTKKR